MRIEKLGKKLTISLVSLVFFVGCSEAVLRLIVQSNTVFNINLGGAKEHHPERGAQLKKNYKSAHVSINSHGTLGPEFSIVPDPKSVRIMTLGNSLTFLPPQRNYSRVLDDHLSSAFSASEVEVIVGAVPGYGSREVLHWYNEFLHRLQPDIAIICVGWNDMGQFHPFGLKYKNEGIYRQKTLIGTLMNYLYVMRLPYFVLGRLEKMAPIDLGPLTSEQQEQMDAFIPSHYEANLRSLIGALREDGSKVYLLGFAGLITYTPVEAEYPRLHFPRNTGRKLALYKAIYQKYEAVLREVAKSTQTPVIEMAELIKSPEERQIFTDTMHINVDGAEVYGAFIAQRLQPAVGELLAIKAGANR